MIIWTLAEPHEDNFARAIRLGEWSKNDEGQDIRTSPLVIEWKPSSTKLGEVTVVGFGSDVFARKEFSKKLSESGVKGYKEGSVIVKRANRKRIPSPETDADLIEIVPEVWVDCDLKKSSVRKAIDTSGNVQYEIAGTERYESYWDDEKKALVRKQIFRQPGSGLLVPCALLGSPLVFRVKQFPTFFCCTDDAKNIMKNIGVTNVEFLQIGETV